MNVLNAQTRNEKILLIILAFGASQLVAKTEIAMLEQEVDPVLGLTADRSNYAKEFNKNNAAKGQTRGQRYAKFRVGKNTVTPIAD